MNMNANHCREHLHDVYASFAAFSQICNCFCTCKKTLTGQSYGITMVALIEKIYNIKQTGIFFQNYMINTAGDVIYLHSHLADTMRVLYYLKRFDLGLPTKTFGKK